MSENERANRSSSIRMILATALGAAIAVLFDWFLERYRAQRDQRDLQYQIAAFRFELESNLRWLENVFETLNYLRDEAWIKMKNEGDIMYLPSPIPAKSISVYDKLYQLNEQLRVLKETRSGCAQIDFELEDARTDRDQLRKELDDLIWVLDQEYPEIAKAFRRRER